MVCSEAGGYANSAIPLSEQLCERTVADHEPHMNDGYKQPYVEVCHQLDETLADMSKAGSSKNLELRFEAMERRLKEMISSSELSNGDKGRYLYQIDARVLYAYLPAFWHRAEYGYGVPLPEEVIEDTYKRVVEILEDFDGLYSGIATQVALRRTEVEILALLLRTKSPDFFPYPTLFREDASETRMYNHDAYIINDGRKTPIQIKNTDYKTPSGTRVSSAYMNQTIVAIHQKVVNLDYKEGETLVTTIEGDDKPTIEHKHDVIDDYDAYDEQPRFVAWGATPINKEAESGFQGEYIQVLDSKKRDGLLAAISKEARGRRLSPTDRNLLNSASHYLMATIREKQAAR